MSSSPSNEYMVKYVKIKLNKSNEHTNIDFSIQSANSRIRKRGLLVGGIAVVYYEIILKEF